MTRRIAWSFGLVLLAGCADEGNFVLTCRATDGSLHRRLEAWDEHGRTGEPPMPRPPGPGTLERLEALYGGPGVDRDGKRVFEGTFEQPPHDLGNSGRFVVRETTLGSAYSYAEEFGGSADRALALERRVRSAGLLARVLGEWVEAEVPRDALEGALGRFVAGPFREDVRNVSSIVMDAFHASPNRGEALQGEIEARLAVYLHRRGYDCGPAGPPPLLIGLGDALLGMLRTRLAREMGAREGDPTPAALGFLRPDRVEASWKAFAARSPTIAGVVETTGRPAGEDPATAFVNAVLEGLRSDGQPLRRLRVALECPVEPTRTNGRWSSDDRSIDWPWADVHPFGVPLLRYADWAVPDIEGQRALFGATVLRGERLEDYVQWRASLPDARGRAWDAFLDSLRGKERSVVAEVRGFRPTEEEDWAAGGREILLDVLDP